MMVGKVKLGSVAKVLNGYAFKSKEYVDSGIRVVRITNVQKGRIKDDDPKFIDIHRRDEFSRFMLADGDILISLTGNVGRVGVIDESMLPAALNQRVGALKIESEEVDPNYLFHILNSESFEHDAIKNSKGIAQLNLSSKWIESYQIPLPPLTEQKRIAAILDAADALRAKRRESLAQLDTLLQSTFLDMFGDPVTNPKGWKSVSFNQIGKYQSGATPSKACGEYWNGSIPWVSPKDMKVSRIADSQDHVSELAFKKTNLKLLTPGHLLIVVRGMILAHSFPVAVNTVPVAINQDMKGILPIDGTELPFLLECVRHLKRAILSEVSTAGHGTRRFDAEAMKKIMVPLPPIELQRRFATIVESVEQQKARLREHLAELDTLFASLQQRAFNGDL